MADRVILAARSAIELAPGRSGAAAAAPGVSVALIAPRLASVIAGKGAAALFQDICQRVWGFAPPVGPHGAANAGRTILGVGPGRFLFVDQTNDGAWPSDLASALDGVAAVCDQSDGYAIFEIGGVAARLVLAQGAPVDLHPAAFAADGVAVTTLAHMGAVIWRADDAFRIAVFRSHAGSFWTWFTASAAEYGLDTRA